MHQPRWRPAAVILGIQAAIALLGTLAGLVLAHVGASASVGLVMALILAASAIGVARRHSGARLVAIGLELLFAASAVVGLVTFLHRDVFTALPVDPATAAGELGMQSLLGLVMPALVVIWLARGKARGERT